MNHLKHFQYNKKQAHVPDHNVYFVKIYVLKNKKDLIL